MDSNLTELVHDVAGGYGRVQVWGMPNDAWYDYVLFDEAGKEIARSNDGWGSSLYCLRAGLNVLLAPFD